MYIGLASSEVTCAARVALLGVVGGFSMRIVNSSEPNRATVALSPETTRCRRSATDRSTRFPISRPSPSLMTARPAKSILNTA